MLWVWMESGRHESSMVVCALSYGQAFVVEQGREMPNTA